MEDYLSIKFRKFAPYYNVQKVQSHVIGLLYMEAAFHYNQGTLIIYISFIGIDKGMYMYFSWQEQLNKTRCVH